MDDEKNNGEGQWGCAVMFIVPIICYTVYQIIKMYIDCNGK